jgi:OmpA-OmpF porin, OOP family
MKNYKLLVALFTVTTFAVAQTDTGTKDFNKWSVEVSGGQNKAVRPFAVGYYSSDPSKYFNFAGITHYDFGVRYMLSNSFGLKVDYAMDQFTEQSGAGSLSFDTKLNRFGFQGVMNLGRLLRFESFSNRLGLLTHAGVHVSQLSVKEGANKNITEDNGGVMFGITPQVRLTKWLALTADFTVINNIRQHLNWDGSAAISDDNLSGMMYNTTLGLTFYLGKKEKHADWYIAQAPFAKENEEALQRIEAIETAMNDTDRDGVVDYLDVENNTPNGVAVDTKGRFIDTNNNGTPDEIEPKIGKETTTTALAKVTSAENDLVEKGLINVFFDINNDYPNAGSTNNVYTILHYLKVNPTSKAKLIGFADVRGDEQVNQDLSQRRAQNVYEILVASGIAADRISIEGQGVDGNYPNSTIGLDLARRVSIKIEK